MSRSPHAHDLIDLALGRLEPRRREEVESALARDPSLRARYADVRDHLACYDDDFSSPPPPPATRILARLPEQPSGLRYVPFHPAARLAAGLLLAAVVVSLVVAVVGPRPPSPSSSAHLARVEAAIEVARDGVVLREEEVGLRTGDRLEAVRPARAWFGPRVEAVLDEGARLTYRSDEVVELAAGRVWFRVAPGGFRVDTPYGAVVVKGTVFEVTLSEGALEVRVAEGRVLIDGAIALERGSRWDGERVHPLASEVVVGAWFLRPRLEVRGPRYQPVGESLELEFSLGNPGPLPLAVAPTEGGRTELWLTVEDPAGAVHDLPVPGATAGWRRADDRGALEVVLAPREVRASVASFDKPFGDPGVYRCRAMYRPREGPPLVSSELLIEVHE